MTETSESFLRIRTVLAKTGLSRSTLDRKMEAGKFPRQIKIAERCCAWRSSAVDAWLHNPFFYQADEEGAQGVARCPGRAAGGRSRMLGPCRSLLPGRA